MKISDYFAELFIAGRLADVGWNIYFPHRGQGFDFIITKRISTGELLIRPVQVKGKYPTDDKGDQSLYGYVGSLDPPSAIIHIFVVQQGFGSRLKTRA